jgi:hypothetical protein
MAPTSITDPRQIVADVAALLAGIDAVKAAKTPEEEAAARLILDMETTLQWAVIRQRTRAALLDSLRRAPEIGD